MAGVILGVLIALLAGISAVILLPEWYREQDALLQRQIDAAVNDGKTLAAPAWTITIPSSFRVDDQR